MLPSDIYSQSTAADPVLDERTVLDLAPRHGVRCSAVTRIDETGGEARVYMLDNNLVLKVQRAHRLRPRISLEKEVFCLQQLAADSDIFVPHVLGYGRQHNIEYTVMTQMPGVPVLTVDAAPGTGALASTAHNLDGTSAARDATGDYTSGGTWCR